MDLSDFIGELCTVDSAFFRGWRWLFSARYRASMRLEREIHGPLANAALVLEALVFMSLEIAAVVLLLRWLFVEGTAA